MKFFTTRILFFIPVLNLLLVSNVSAQKYLPGYVLLNNGDTLQGLIETEPWRRAPMVVRFKSAPNSEVHVYSPLLIHSFRVNGGGWYFSYVGDIDPSSLLDTHLTYDPTPDTMRVAFFIRVVVMGKASLYYARDQNDRVHLFLQKDKGAIRELNYKKYYRDEVVVATYQSAVTRRAIISNQIYKQQLMIAFSDCKSVAMHLFDRPFTYSKNDLMGPVIDYNRCMNSKMEYHEEKETWKLEMSLHAGINYTSIKVIGPEVDEETTRLSPELGFAAGVALNIVISQTQEQWSIYNELFVKDYKSTGTSEFQTSSGSRDIEMDLAYVKLASMVRYQVPRGKVKPFLNFGLTNGLCIKDDIFAISSNGEKEDFLQPIRKYEQGLIFGVGLRWKNISLDGRAEFSNGISEYSNIKTSFSTMYCLLGYTF